MEPAITSSWTDAGGVDAFVAAPVEGGPYPGVVLGFEMFGVTGYVCRVAQRLAGAGFVVVVPDFYHRYGTRLELTADPAGREQGLALVQHLSRVDVREDMLAVSSYLDSRDDTTGRPSMLGLSLGGHIGFVAAAEVPLAALVAFYPGWLTDTSIELSRPEPTITLAPALKQSGVRVLVLIGADDHLYQPAQRDQIGQALRDSGVEHEFVVYPDAPHGFLCDERDSYRPAVADHAWTRAVTFLGPQPSQGGAHVA